MMRTGNTTSQRGFTLIEVIIIVAIIVILVSMAAVATQTFRQNSRDVRRITDVKQITYAMERYFEKCRQYPAALATSAANGCPSGVTLADYLPTIPTDPLGTSYSFATSGAGSNHDAYLVRATLERDNSELGDDVDGLTYQGVSLDCDDASLYYCLGSQ